MICIKFIRHLFTEWTAAVGLSHREQSVAQHIFDSRDVYSCTHCGATHEDDYEGAKDASDPNHPCHPQEEDHPKNVLDTWQIHSHESAQLWSLKNTTVETQFLIQLISLSM